MQNNTQPDTNGLKAILNHNETVQPNYDLLNTLKATIPRFFDKDGNFKADKFEDELKKNNITEARDGYKLGFVGKDYARLQVGLKSETMIVPDCKHNNKPENDKSSNVFITGDNIDALRHLVNAYENQIKLIYIDPPYNTGKEFTYNDKFEFTDRKLKSILDYTEEEIARLKSIQGKSSHSAWLTFMYPRLKIAHKLLKEDGVIFVSIDDNEQANIKLILDDVFGEGNFVANLPTIMNLKGNNDEFAFAGTHEYAIVYARNKKLSIFNEFVIKDDEIDEWETDEYGYYKKGANLKATGVNAPRTKRPNLFFPLYITDNNECFTKRISKNDIEIFPITSNEEMSWRWEKRKFENEQHNIIIMKEDNNISIYKKQRPGLGDIPSKKPKTIFYKPEYSSGNGTQQLKDLFTYKCFDNPKPIDLIQDFIELTTEKNSLILDFFAGSSTTAHAILQLNVEDGGNRKFIMVQLDEKTKYDSEAQKAGYNTIDEIARKRIELAGKKLLADYESDLVKQTNGWDKDIGFKHYRLITPDVKTLEKIIEFNPEETNLIADDMIKPFEYPKTETSGLDTILTTWLIDDGYRFDIHVEEITLGNYKAYYVRESLTLYLINMGWDTKALKDMLNQIGTNKLLVKTIIVYPYSFEFEAMRELKTNIQTNLDNKPALIERF